LQNHRVGEIYSLITAVSSGTSAVVQKTEDAAKYEWAAFSYGTLGIHHTGPAKRSRASQLEPPTSALNGNTQQRNCLIVAWRSQS
jgi:hypothetical protein